MAHITPSPAARKITGKAGNVIFTSRKGRAYIKADRPQKPSNTNPQIGSRGLLRKMNRWWIDLPSIIKTDILRQAFPRKITPFDLFVQTNLPGLTPENWSTPPTPPPVPSAPLLPETAPTRPIESPQAEPGETETELRLTWSPAAADPQHDMYVLVEKHDTPWDQSDLRHPVYAEAKVTDTTLTLTNLDPLTTYDMYTLVKDPSNNRFSQARACKGTTAPPVVYWDYEYFDPEWFGENP